MENNAIKVLIRALEEDRNAAETGFSVHVAHLADSASLADINAAKKKGACLQSQMISVLLDSENPIFCGA